MEEARRRICFFGTYDERAHPRVSVLRQGLAALGHDVVACNHPLDFDTSARVAVAQKPWRAPLLLLRVVAAWTALLWRSRTVSSPDVVVVGYLGHFDVHLARLRFPRSVVVLDHMVGLADTAIDRRIPADRGVVRLLNAIDHAALRRAHIVVCDTRAQVDMLGDQAAKAIVVPVGAPEAWFDAGRSALAHLDTGSGDPLRVVFFGLYTPLQGAPVIGSAIAEIRRRGLDVSFTMIGSGQDEDATFENMGSSGPDVRRVPWVEADELPTVVAEHDVCLGVFGTTPKGLRVVPNKVYQGAAAGAVVVTSDTASQREALDDVGIFTRPGDPASLADAIAALVMDRESTIERRHRTAEHARDRFAPDKIVGPLHDRIAK